MNYTSLDRLSPAAEAWRDPEFWGPRGLGCSWCHERPPIVMGLGCGAICDACLERRLAPWLFDRIVNWLGQQRGVLLRNGERVAALRGWDERGDLNPALAYERKYGVWLLNHPHP